VSGYKAIVGRPTFGLAPFAWHGVNTTERDGEKQAMHKHQRGGEINRAGARLQWKESSGGDENPSANAGSNNHGECLPP
jgi:hypothetical protein